MKKLLSIVLSLSMVFSLSTTAFASEQPEHNELQISRTALDKIRGNTPVMSEAMAQEATDLISQKAYAEHLNEIDAAQQPYGVIESVNPEIQRRTQEINAIEAELEAMGAIPLTIEDIYALHDRAYRPGAPDVPDDTKYVSFYGMTANIGNYEVWNIVAYSPYYDQSEISVPFYMREITTLFDADTYVKGDFSKYIDMAANTGSTFFKKAFDKMPLLDYIGTVWDISTYFNPTATQMITLDYDATQMYIYSYVAEKSVGYFDFIMAAERIQGSCILSCRQKDASGSHVKEVKAEEYEVKSAHYTDYDHAVDLYKKGTTHYAYYVGPIKFTYNGKQLAKISMPTYSEIWSIPGI